MKNTERRKAISKVNRSIEKRKPSTIPLPLLIDALDRNKGNMTSTAQELNIRYFDLANMVDRQVDLKNVCLSHREGLVDLAEDNLRDALENVNNLKATFFTLKHLGKDRGYVEKTETETRITEIKAQVDLSKLSIDQLKELDIIMGDAEVIDITPEEP